MPRYIWRLEAAAPAFDGVLQAACFERRHQAVPGAREQPETRRILEVGDQAADVGLRYVQDHGRPGYRSAPHGRAEDFQLARIRAAIRVDAK